MPNSISNPCIRCGNERVVVKTWQEQVYNSTITNTERACSNPDCQKKVDQDNKKNRDRHNALQLKSEQRAVQRRVAREAEKHSKQKTLSIG